jgi:hypothetical protein
MIMRVEGHLSGSNTICILGMHRSGTSCLTGSLQEAGLILGEVVTEAPFNRKGNRESLPIRELHEDILTANHSAWNRPSQAAVTWSAEHRARRDAIIASYPADSLWGFKDPRTLLVLAGWREALPAMRFVGTFRHPLAVAASLASRDGSTIEQGLALWCHYNQLLLHYHRELGFEVISFDLPEERYHEQLVQLATRMGLTPPTSGFTFFDGKLRKAAVPAGDTLPADVARIYDQLLQITGSP